MALAWHRVPGVDSSDKGLMGKKEFEGKNMHAGYIGVLCMHTGPQTLHKQKHWGNSFAFNNREMFQRPVFQQGNRGSGSET